MLKGKLYIKHNFSYENYKYIKTIIDDSVSEINKKISCKIKELQYQFKLNSELLINNGKLTATSINYCTNGDITIGLQYVCLLWIVCYLYIEKKEEKQLVKWGHSLFDQNSEWPHNAISPLCTDSSIDDVNRLCTSSMIFSLLHEIGHASNPPSIYKVEDISSEIEFTADKFAKSIYNDEIGIIISFLCLDVYNHMCSDSQQLLCPLTERLSNLGIIVPNFNEEATRLKNIICNN